MQFVSFHSLLNTSTLIIKKNINKSTFLFYNKIDSFLLLFPFVFLKTISLSLHKNINCKILHVTAEWTGRYITFVYFERGKKRWKYFNMLECALSLLIRQHILVITNDNIRERKRFLENAYEQTYFLFIQLQEAHNELLLLLFEVPSELFAGAFKSILVFFSPYCY